jgi:hypothetical protein
MLINFDVEGARPCNDVNTDDGGDEDDVVLR